MSYNAKSGWYSVSIQAKCANSYCHTPAKEEVFNRFNASMGKFCARCAAHKVRESSADPVPLPAAARDARSHD